jgi:hypothetical protein
VADAGGAFGGHPEPRNGIMLSGRSSVTTVPPAPTATLREPSASPSRLYPVSVVSSSHVPMYSNIWPLLLTA